MNNVTPFENASPRAASIEQLVAVLPECIKRAAEDVGVDGMIAFFNGYKTSSEEQKIAA